MRCLGDSFARGPASWDVASPGGLEDPPHCWTDCSCRRGTHPTCPADSPRRPLSASRPVSHPDSRAYSVGSGARLVSERLGDSLVFRRDRGLTLCATAAVLVGRCFPRPGVRRTGRAVLLLGVAGPFLGGPGASVRLLLFGLIGVRRGGLVGGRVLFTARGLGLILVFLRLFELLLFRRRHRLDDFDELERGLHPVEGEGSLLSRTVSLYWSVKPGFMPSFSRSSVSTALNSG